MLIYSHILSFNREWGGRFIKQIYRNIKIHCDCVECVSEREGKKMQWPEKKNACLYVSNHAWPLPENSIRWRHICEGIYSKDHEKAIVQKFQTQIYLQKYTRGPLNLRISATIIGRMSQRVKSHLIGKCLYRCSYYLSISERILCAFP